MLLSLAQCIGINEKKAPPTQYNCYVNKFGNIIEEFFVRNCISRRKWLWCWINRRLEQNTYIWWVRKANIPNDKIIQEICDNKFVRQRSHEHEIGRWWYIKHKYSLNVECRWEIGKDLHFMVLLFIIEMKHNTFWLFKIFHAPIAHLTFSIHVLS